MPAVHTKPVYTRIDLAVVDITTPDGWEKFNTDALAQWLDSCDEDERSEYFTEVGIDLGQN